MANMSERDQVTSTVTADAYEADRISFVQDARTKREPLTNLSALLQEGDEQLAEENACRRPDKNLTAAIWTIVCGVALPCKSITQGIADMLCADINFEASPSSSFPPS